MRKVEASGDLAEETNTLKDVAMEGYFTPGIEEMVVTKVKPWSLPGRVKDMVKDTSKQVGLLLVFPKRLLKEGDTFSQKMQIAVPISGWKSITLIIDAAYTVKSIEEDVALLDIAEQVNLAYDGETHIKIGGPGEGTMIFDLSKNQPLKYTSTMEVKFEIEEGDRKASGRMKASTASIYGD